MPLLSVLTLLLTTSCLSAAEPKLVLLIAVDQMRYDYLPRHNAAFRGGLRTLVDKGANFVNAHLEHYPSVTAIGHSTMLSGATPSVSGIIGNDWFDRESGKQVTSVSDPATRLLGGSDESGSSPHRLLVSTLGDEVKRASGRQSRVFGVSLKDRSAILPAGRSADGAFWFSDDTGEIVSSTWYFSALPLWVVKFNEARRIDAFAGKTWLANGSGEKPRRVPAEIGPMVYSSVYSSPYGNELLTQFAEELMKEEKIGQRGVTDVLSVSYSSNDAVGHAFGPDSPEVEALTLSADREIGRLLEIADRLVGAANMIVALTADHGVASIPETLAANRMAGGRIKGDFFAPIRKALEARYGAGAWLLSTAGSSPYFNYRLIDEKGLDAAEVRAVAAEALRSLPQVSRVYTREQLLDGRFAADRVDSRVVRSYFPRRSGDLEIILDPGWIRGSTQATHGSPYNYDSHIPLILMGPMFRAGRYYRAAALNDLAPTLAAVLDVETPSGSVGRVLEEALVDSLK
jgi:predicted AlkP superfamily pyrophosphatase or phosphodiesterase